MPTKEKTKQERLEEAVEWLKKALIESIESKEATIKSRLREEKAHYELVKAKENFYAIEREVQI